MARRVAMRTRVKRLYFPGDARNITLGKPGQYRNLRGRNAHLPPRTAQRTKIVPLPKDAQGLHLTARPPKGPLQAVA